MTTDQTIRVMIADDHPIFRDGLKTLLSSVEGIEIIGEAASGTEVVRLTDQLKPDVILMDIRMPGMNGLEATRHIVHRHPNTAILIITMLEDDNFIFTAMRAGARGYLLKGADQDEVLRAINAVHNGEAIFSASIANRVIHYFAAGNRQSSEEPFPELTNREREILELIAQGMSNTEIANKLFLSGKTVRNYVSAILTKLQVADRAEAILRARAAGITGDLS